MDEDDAEDPMLGLDCGITRTTLVHVSSMNCHGGCCLRTKSSRNTPHQGIVLVFLRVAALVFAETWTAWKKSLTVSISAAIKSTHGGMSLTDTMGVGDL